MLGAVVRAVYAGLSSLLYLLAWQHQGRKPLGSYAILLALEVVLHRSLPFTLARREDLGYELGACSAKGLSKYYSILFYFGYLFFIPENSKIDIVIIGIVNTTMFLIIRH